MTSYFYNGVMIQGINLGGDPMWGLAGSFGTGIIFYCAREYAHHTAYYVYETADGLRLGFQMHTILGFPGRKIEASIHNIRIINPVGGITLGSSLIPLRVEGVGKNVLIDRDCTFYANNRLMKLLEGVTEESGNSNNTDAAMNQISKDSKLNRIDYFSKAYNKRKSKKQSSQE